MRLQLPPGRREHRLDMRGGAGRHGGAVGGAERALLEIGEGRPEILADQFAPVRDLRLRPAVEVGEAPAPVEHEHAVGGALQRRLQAALAHLQPGRHGVEGGAEPVELRSLGRQAGARPEIAAADLRHRPQQPLGRPAHKVDGGDRHQRGRQQGGGDDQRNAALVGPVKVAECLRGAEPHQDAKAIGPGAGGGIGDHPGDVVVAAPLGHARRVPLQQGTHERGGRPADEAGAVGATGQHGAVPIDDRRDGAGRQLDPVEFLRQPVQAERQHHDAADVAGRIVERLGETNHRRSIRRGGEHPGRESAGPQRLPHHRQVGRTLGGGPGAMAADHVTVRGDQHPRAVARKARQQSSRARPRNRWPIRRAHAGRSRASPASAGRPRRSAAARRRPG